MRTVKYLKEWNQLALEKGRAATTTNTKPHRTQATSNVREKMLAISAVVHKPSGT